MGRLAVFFIFVLFALLVFTAPGQGTGKEGQLRITSPDLENNKQIPKKYTCDGLNINPPLKIENVPPGAKSLALVFDDTDAPRGSYVHWILWNLPPDTGEIKENSIPAGAVQGLNDFKKNNYGGPCPPRRAHRYVFKVYALDVRLDLGPQKTKADLEKAMEGHVIARGQLVGVYQKEKRK